MILFLKRLYGAVLLVLFTLTGNLLAQDMEVTNAPPITPENLITNIFLGEGVEVVSVDYQGPPLSVGFFKNGQEEVGIGRGIIMSTGYTVSEGANVGAESVGFDFASGSTLSTASDPDISQIVGNANDVNDMAKYTITFIPISDTLRFNYVFASEEYPEYVCSDFNDVFGFFISGPGINGPYENNGENIALIPGTSLPVTINNLNPGVVGSAGIISNCTPPNGSLDFSQYYIDNDGTTNQPVYDGYTQVLTAQAIVTPCEEYTIKLIIADVGDDAFDSGVFLEAKSFGTGSLKVEAVTVSLDGTVSEGCAEGLLTFKLPTPTVNDFPIDYNIFGTATNGVDYELIPPDIFIPAGSDSISVPIIAFEDGIDEMPETLLIDVQKDVCNRDTISIIIKDNPTIPPDLGPDLSICPLDSVQLDGTIDVPLPPPPTFTNNTPLAIPSFNIPVFSDIEVSNVVPQTLGPGVILEVCIDSLSHRWIDDLDIYLISPDGQFLELTTDNGGSGGTPELAVDWYYQTCFTTSAPLPINYPGPYAPDSAVPFTGNFLPEGVWSDLWDGSRNTNGTWRLQLIDDQFNLDGLLYSWHISFEPVYKLSYNWSPAEGLSCTDCPNPIAFPNETTTYSLTITDSYGCTQMDEITIEVRPHPDAPTPNCQNVTESTITINWADVPDAIGYEVSIDGGASWIPPSGALSHTVTGLDFVETVEILVRSLSDDCGSPFTGISCTTLDCPGAVGTIATTGVSCPGSSDGTATVNITSGTSPFTFDLNGEQNTTGVFTGLDAGSHTVVVTDGVDCASPFDFIIAAPDTINAVFVIIDSISCQGGNDGRITVDITSGTGPFTFNWSNGTVDSIATGLTVGMYSVIITGTDNCSKEYSITLTEPSLLSLSSSQEEVDCNGSATGSASIMASGGTSPYQYQWDANAGNQTVPSVTNLSAGTYTVSVTDAHNCLQTETFTITEPSALTSTVDSTLNGCGAPSGTASVEVTGGTPPYVYEWNTSPVQNTPIATNLSEGIYTVTVTDANDCTIENTVEVLAPPMINLSYQSTDILCNGNATGSITAEASGGTGAFTYSWQEAGLPASSVVNNLEGGTYHLTVTDELGCTATETITISEPAPIIINSDIDGVACFGANTGAIDITAYGGTGELTYLWSTGSTDEDLNELTEGGYSLTVTDENQCTAVRDFTITATTSIDISFSTDNVDCYGQSTGNIRTQVQGGSMPYSYDWSNGATTPNLYEITAAVYYLTVTDSQGCQETDSVVVKQPNMPLQLTLSIDSVSCFGEKDGRIDMQVNGGTPPYSYSSDNNIYTGVSSLLGLAAGKYNVFIRDARGCTIFESDIEVGEPNLLVLDLGADITLDYGDETSLTPAIQSDVPIVEYIWTPSLEGTLSCLDCPNPEVSTTSQIHVLLEIINESGCKAEDLISIFVKKDFQVFVPTGFTPNGDGVNDELIVHGHDKTTITTFRIFDRWGELVFERSDFPANDVKGWDGTFNGKAAATGVYIWTAEAVLPDGETAFFDGETSLIR